MQVRSDMAFYLVRASEPFMPTPLPGALPLFASGLGGWASRLAQEAQEGARGSLIRARVGARAALQ